MLDMNFAPADIQAALALHLVGQVESLSTAVRQVQTDSRKVGPGDLFVCLKGERFDAHDFASDVVNAGAVALLVDRELPIKIPQFVVRDTRLALGALAAKWRSLFSPKVLAVVGSNGKTTSKEMLASVCKAHFGEAQTLVTAGNLNNDIGVPLTLFNLRQHHAVAVIEMGMNHPGEIDYLTGLVKPDVVLLTNAQREHQEFMKSVEAVALENGSAFKHLPSHGVAVFPANTEFDSIWVSLAAGANIERFGAGGSFEFAAPASSNASAKLTTPHGALLIHPAFLGEHNFNNAAGAAAAAMSAGCDLLSVQKGLDAFKPVSGRLQIAARSSRVLLINDAYNANPDSVNAASLVLRGLGGNTLLVLGDMGEVGDQSDEYHAEVGQFAKTHGVAHLFALGEATHHTVKAFGKGAVHFDRIEELIEHIQTNIKNGDWSVLVKGSRFMKMERVVEALKTHMAETGENEQHAS